MSKKTSRTARTQQNSRLQEVKREVSARPIIPTNGVVKSGSAAVASEPLKMSISASDMADAVAVKPVENVQKREPIQSVVAPRPVGTAKTAIPPRRFLNAQPRQNAPISREEEYRFIRADLVTVFVLAVLMIVVLVVLTFILGH